MWAVISDNDISMAEGDYGVQLPIKINGMTLTTGDTIAVVIKKAVNGEEVLTKTYNEFTDNTVKLELTEQDTALLPKGDYVYRVDAYQDGNYLNNLIRSAIFKVVDIA